MALLVLPASALRLCGERSQQAVEKCRRGSRDKA